MCTLLLTFYKKGWDVDNVTRILLLGLLSVTLMWAIKTRSENKPANLKRLFVGTGVLFAALEEGCYMISHPFLLSLTIRLSVIWWLINNYRYGRWEYIFIFALGSRRIRGVRPQGIEAGAAPAAPPPRRVSTANRVP